MDTPRVDPITFEIFRSRLAAINDEAAMTLRLVSGSPVANEAYDMNTALMTPGGECFAIGVYISIHAMSLASTVQFVQDLRRSRSLRPVRHVHYPNFPAPFL